jgi:putative lipoic acid-binding regulatory protein
MSSDQVTIVFPCPNYPVKVIGEARAEFQQDVEACFTALAVHYAPKVHNRDSRAARFAALTFMITAESEAQLSQLNTELRKVQGVRLVL